MISRARASELTKRPTSFYTLPISDFGADSNGSDVNIVDLPTIRQIVHDVSPQIPCPRRGAPPRRPRRQHCRRP
ncbi:hypothetical protein I540_6061, partial [Mycobacteroides abscessus subsp. bolletii 1513]